MPECLSDPKSLRKRLFWVGDDLHRVPHGMECTPVQTLLVRTSIMLLAAG